MADITASMVNALRQKTGVSMMQCKKALVEAEGNEEKAIEILRKKGAAKAADKADRETKEGAVRTLINGGKAVVVSLNCETDFVARNDAFVALADKIAQLFFDKGDAATEEVDALIKEAIVTLGENITLKEYKVIEGTNLGDYIHLNNTIGVVVALSGGEADLAKGVAMHVAAINPAVTTPDEVDAESIEKEKDIFKEQLRNEGKPEDMLDKIIEGKVKKFKEEQALMTQGFVKDPSQTVAQTLGDVTVETFVRLTT